MKTLLFIFLSFIALTAMVSGILLISNPDGSVLQLSTNLLKGTGFNNFLLPGIVLTFLVGGVNLAAAIMTMQHHRLRYNWAIAGGMVIAGWIIIQVMLIRSLHWLHFIYLGMGILVVLIAYQLKGKWVV